ncbi:aminoglycoside phosphotransferase family protein, partial [Patescibacteria group bacterium]|nr:aminoglycoside phosphotransferase family protein [Patescibacteria group bacterium]
DPKISGLQTEAENLKWISNKVSPSKRLNVRIPELIYSGVEEDIRVFVTTFLDAKNVKLSSHYIMNKGFDKIGITNGFFRKNIGFAEERLFLKRIDGKIRQAINALVEFQQITSNSRSDLRDIANNIMDNYLKKHQGRMLDEIKQSFLILLKDKIRCMPEIEVLTCSVHGDYDFDNVLFFTDGGIGLVDFEHLEKEGSLFFDLATLIFNPLIMKWQSSYLRNESFKKYLNQYGAIKYISKWLECFCDKQHLPYSIKPIIPLIAAVEQNTKVYPSFRDPNTYPMYGENIFEELLSINID